MPSDSSSSGAEADWDLTPYFPEFEGAEYRRFRDALASDSADLLARTLALSEINDGNLAAWGGLLAELEKLHARSNHLAGYLVMCLSAGTGLLLSQLASDTAKTWKEPLRRGPQLPLSPKITAT